MRRPGSRRLPLRNLPARRSVEPAPSSTTGPLSKPHTNPSTTGRSHCLENWICRWAAPQPRMRTRRSYRERELPDMLCTSAHRAAACLPPKEADPRPPEFPARYFSRRLILRILDGVEGTRVRAARTRPRTSAPPLLCLVRWRHPAAYPPKHEPAQVPVHSLSTVRSKNFSSSPADRRYRHPGLLRGVCRR